MQTGAASHPGGRSDRLAVKLKPALPEGGYTVTYRVISADSHRVSGSFVFSVGAGAAPAASAGRLPAGRDAGPVTSVAFATVRAVQFAAIVLAIGVLAFMLWAWLPALHEAAGAEPAWRAASSAFAVRLQRLFVGTAAAGVLSAAAGLVLQGATAGGTSAWAAVDPSVVGDVLSTRFGVVWGLGLLGWAWAGAVSVGLGSRLTASQPTSVGATGVTLPAQGRSRLVALALPVAALALLPGVGGHASTQPPVALNLPANVLHVLAVGAWLGGIVVLLTLLRPAAARLESANGIRLLAAGAARFSTLAGVAVAVIIATGIAQSLLAIDAFSQLLNTGYGRSVLIKFALLIGIVGLGWLNRSRHLPALHAAAAGSEAPARAGVALRHALRAELGIAAVMLATTGALAGYPPAEAVPPGHFSTDAALGPTRLELTVEPARVGANTVDLHLFNRRDGRPYDRTREILVNASMDHKDVAPINLDARRAGPGHYVVRTAALGLRGPWTLAIAGGVSDFVEYRATVKVPIR